MNGDTSSSTAGCIEKDRKPSASSDLSVIVSTSDHPPSLSQQQANFNDHSNFFIFDYETLVWVIYGSLTILFVLDRFFWNLWPRETYSIGAGSAGSDFKGGLKPGPWSVKVYDIFARASGRYTILALNLMLFTMMHTLQSRLSETWVARHLIDFTNAQAANRRLHIWNGVGIVVLTLVHVWTILLPCITHGWSAQVVLGSFEWPLSERAPKEFKDADNKTKTMSLQADDVFRLIEMTLLLAFLLPLSFRWFKTRYHVAIHLHNIIQVMYFIDIVRRHTHPHSWILNTPFFIAWVADTVVGFYWRRQKSPAVSRRLLSDDYMLLYWTQSKQLDTVGPKYYVRLQSSSVLERAHVFTAFENRGVGVNVAGVTNDPWSVCLLIRVYDKPRRIRMPKQDEVSHTKGLMNQKNIDDNKGQDVNLHTWGPFLGDMCEAVMRNIRAGIASTVIASGSAAGYLIDSLQQHVAHASTVRMTLLYTTEDMGLYEWVLNVIEQVLQNRKKAQKVGCANFEIGPITAVLALTNGGMDDGKNEPARFVDHMKSKTDKRLLVDFRSNLKDNTVDRIQYSDTDIKEMEDRHVEDTISLQFGRLNFTKLIDDHSTIFFQGSGGLQRVVKRACRMRHGVIFVAGPIYDGDTNRNESLFSKLRNRFCNHVKNT